MNDSEFIELLNLYLDHEISPRDAGRLEREVQNNPERRRVYQQYCRMQKACKVLAVDFQADPPVRTAVGLEKKVAVFDSLVDGRKWTRGIFVTGAVAAAACVAIIFIGRDRPDATGGPISPRNEVAIQPPSMPASATAIFPTSADASRSIPPAGGLVQRPMLVNDPLLLVGKAQANGEFAGANSQMNDQLAWVRTLQLAPLQQRVLIEDLRFDVRPTTLRPEARILGGTHAPAETPTEMNAFRFVK